MPSLPFRLKVPGKDEFRDFNAVSTSFTFHGVLQLEEGGLAIGWRGTAQVQEVGSLHLRDESLVLPDEEIVVPLQDIFRASLVGGWWRPRLRLEAARLGALAMVPSEERGVVDFWYQRRDREAAAALVAALGAVSR